MGNKTKTPTNQETAPNAPAAQHRKRSSLGREGWAAAFLGGPAFLVLFVFLLVPFFLAFALSFTNQRLLSPVPTEFVGLRNYDRLLSMTVLTLEPLVDEETGQVSRDAQGNLQFPRIREITRADPAYADYREWFTFDTAGNRYVVLAKDPIFLRSLINIFLFVIVAIPLQISLALMLALLVNQKIPGTNVFRTIYFSPVVTSMVVISVVWTFLYQRDAGMINQFLDVLTFGLVGPVDWLNNPNTAMLAIIIMSVWQGVGFQMVIFLAGLQGISPELYEAAGIDGANAWNKFWNITLPGLRNTTIFVVIATTIAGFGLFTQVDVMTQGGPANATTTVMFHAVRRGFREQDIAYGAAISVVFFLLILAIALIQRYLMTERQAR